MKALPIAALLCGLLATPACSQIIVTDCGPGGCAFPRVQAVVERVISPPVVQSWYMAAPTEVVTYETPAVQYQSVIPVQVQTVTYAPPVRYRVVEISPVVFERLRQRRQPVITALSRVGHRWRSRVADRLARRLGRVRARACRLCGS